MPVVSLSEWDRFLSRHNNPHLLQSAAWGQLKAQFGWKPVPFINGDSGALVLYRQLPLGFSFGYIPKGPVGKDWLNLWPEIHRKSKKERAIFLRVEPDAWQEEEQEIDTWLPGFFPSRAIQPRRTVEIPLTGDENDWLDRMKQKTRYNIRLAQKKEVIVRASEDVAQFHQMMLVTGKRDGFGVHSLAYYQRAFDLFSATGDCTILQAEYSGNPLAAIMVFACGKRAWYFYGCSSNEERNRMPTYLLQFTAMQWAAKRGCTIYDLWGIPDKDEGVLEAEFSDRQDALWGVYRFKRGFGGQVRRSVGAWDWIYNPLVYRLIRLIARSRGMEE